MASLHQTLSRRCISIGRHIRARKKVFLTTIVAYLLRQLGENTMPKCLLMCAISLNISKYVSEELSSGIILQKLKSL